MNQRRAVVAGDYDPLRIGTPGHAAVLARGQAFSYAIEDPFDSRPWMQQETSGDYDPYSSTDGHKPTTSAHRPEQAQFQDHPPASIGFRGGSVRGSTTQAEPSGSALRSSVYRLARF